MSSETIFGRILSGEIPAKRLAVRRNIGKSR